MKKIYFTLLALLTVSMIIAQSPKAFKYQAIARDEAGNALSLWDISLRVSLLQEGTDGQVVYAETHNVQTNIYGLINLVIGEGKVVKGDFSSVRWGENRHFIKMEMDIDAGTNYKVVGTTQLYAVPYALYAEQAGSVLSSGSGSSSSSRVGVGGGENRNGGANSKFPADGDSHLNVNIGRVGIGTATPTVKLDVIGTIMASEGYNTDGDAGLSDSMNIVTNFDFVNYKFRYRTFVFKGGIITYISSKSGWVDKVGNYLDFVCEDTLLDSRNGQKYAMILIGDQCWLAKNLNIGTLIPGVTNPIEDSEIEKYCYNDSEVNCTTYGGLYQWDEAMGYVTTEGAQGICPEEWHIPSDTDWDELVNFLGGNDVAGGKLKETGFVHWLSPNTEATNSTGFTALPGGDRHYTIGSFSDLGTHVYFWSTTENGEPEVWRRMINKGWGGVDRDTYYKTYGFSVRCLKN